MSVENIPTENIRPIDFSKLPQGLNTNTAKLKQNIAANIRRQLPQLRTYQPQSRSLCIVAGGPSLADTFGLLTEKIERDNAAVLAVNGAYARDGNGGLYAFDMRAYMDGIPFFGFGADLDLNAFKNTATDTVEIHDFAMRRLSPGRHEGHPRLTHVTGDPNGDTLQRAGHPAHPRHGMTT